MRRRIIAAFTMTVAIVGPSGAQGSSDPARILRLIAEDIRRETSYQVIDERTQEVITIDADSKVIPTARFKSDYNDWAYFYGVMLSGMMRAGKTLEEKAYVSYVNDNFRFIFDNYYYFHEQWEVLQVRTGSLYRIYRMNMLDDCGSIGAALVESYQKTRDPRQLRMIQKIANYITNVQLRDEEGMLTRPDPRYMTLWADDLYMSVPFLSRMGELSGETRYFDDAARQVILFSRHLRNEDLNIMHHAWFSDTDEKSVGLWGRANGWMVMAQVELLKRLPSSHPQRDTLLSLLKLHLDGLVRLQTESGLWHQVLNKPDSYLETSCTAMFTYGLAAAVNEGWIDPSYAVYARKGWAGVATKVDSQGKITGICRGTGVGFDLQFYYDRPTPFNDPRGIGAVLLAGSEMIRLSKQ